MIKTLTLPVATIVAIASVEDPTLRQQLIDAVEKGTADPDTFRADDYDDDADPLIRDLVRRIVRRAERSRRYAERKAKRGDGKDARSLRKDAATSPTPDAQAVLPSGHEYLLPTDGDRVIVGARHHMVTLPVNDANIRRCLWFKHNFKTFVDNTLAAFKSLRGYDELYERLIPSFEYVTAQLARAFAPMAKQAADVMKMPRHSRPSTLYYEVELRF